MENTAKNIIVIGGSAGAYELIVEILDHLPKVFSAAIVVVLHRNYKYETKVEDSLSRRLNLQVNSVKDKNPILSNQIYFAPPGYHLLIEPDFRFSLDISEPVHFSRPSIDVFFESVADIYGEKCTAFLLSGANSDGAQGMKKLSESGATCIVQSLQDAKIDTMPKSALNLENKISSYNNTEIIQFFSNLD